MTVRDTVYHAAVLATHAAVESGQAGEMVPLNRFASFRGASIVTNPDNTGRSGTNYPGLRGTAFLGDVDPFGVGSVPTDVHEVTLQARPVFTLGRLIGRRSVRLTATHVPAEASGTELVNA